MMCRLQPTGDTPEQVGPAKSYHTRNTYIYLIIEWTKDERVPTSVLTLLL